ncbi:MULTISPECIES: phage head closure protein [Brevundimonas]|uniref:phage head closure protein n=1 Tax=Brevundimonas TaxID=41275 RepID=UPI0025B87C33|nr:MULTISPECIES: phage head closure protein [Brevundimonas]
MRAGELDRRVTLQRAVITRDDYNNEVSTWGDLASVWAKYEPVSDGEKFRAGERASEIGARFTIRYSSQVSDLTPKDQLVFSGRTYAITRVKEIGRRFGLEITVVGRDDVS